MKNKWSDLFGSEWNYVQRLGSCISDPEEKKAFWESVRDKKLANPHYSIYDDFPRAESVKKSAMKECCDFVRSLRKPKQEEAS